MARPIPVDAASHEMEADMPDLVRKSRESRDRSEQTANKYLKAAGGIDIAKIIPALKSAREAAGMTLAQVSAASGITVPTLSKLETGLHENPTLRTVRRYANAVGKRLVVKPEDT